jgi:hypothetical protein
MIGAWREEAQRSMRPPSVVVGAVPSEDGPQVSLAEDQDAVGELGSDSQWRRWYSPQFQDLRMVDAPTRWPSLRISSWMRW